MSCWWEWGYRGNWGKGGCNGQLALSKGPARMGIHHQGQGVAIPSKEFFLSYLNTCPTYHYNMCLRVLNKKIFFVQVNNNPASGSDSCVYSWLTGPYGSKQFPCNFLTSFIFFSADLQFLEAAAVWIYADMWQIMLLAITQHHALSLTLSWQTLKVVSNGLKISALLSLSSFFKYYFSCFYFCITLSKNY